MLSPAHTRPSRFTMVPMNAWSRNIRTDDRRQASVGAGRPNPITRGSSSRRGRQDGFTYMILLIAIAILGVALGATGEIWGTVQKRTKERELLNVGDEYRRAIATYYAHGGGGARYPLSLEDLLRDPRNAGTQRYLRKLYPDPVTGKTWGLLKDASGEIHGVYSVSDEVPIKQANFGPAYARFEGQTKYSDWVFEYVPGGIGPNALNTPLTNVSEGVR